VLIPRLSLDYGWGGEAEVVERSRRYGGRRKGAMVHFQFPTDKDEGCQEAVHVPSCDAQPQDVTKEQYELTFKLVKRPGTSENNGLRYCLGGGLGE